MGFSTDAVHGGQQAEPTTGAVMTPIFQTSTFKQDGLGRHRGYEYARTQNPTREALERNIAVLERGKHAVAYASGLSAIAAIMHLFKSGDEVVVTENVYGGTYRLADTILSQYGLRFKFVDTSNLDVVKQAVTENTKLVFVETPTNPLLHLTDIQTVASLAHSSGALVAVDNTFMSPYFQNPLELGADVVVHSSTKFLNGHSDMVGGVVVVNDEALAERFRYIQNSVGAVPGPFDCFLALRGTKTLALRMRQHEANARHLAGWLSKHSSVTRLYYPGLDTHPQHELAKKQARGYGGIIALDVGPLEHAQHVLENVSLFTLAESLGGVESLISHPATMTHASVPREDRLRLGISDGLVRLSVGIEDVEDLENDLADALSF
ncbi:MAG: PLP-dependent transferase [Candidatus Latescibacterota bacterium]|nr:MAG: PLP-dependent transferase [Candidatus Latescibacterota bacterium]